MPDSIFNYGGTFFVLLALPALGIIAKFFGVTFQRISKWYCYAAVFCVVVVINSILFPFIGGKDYFFRWAVELGLIAFLLWWGFEAQPGEVERTIRTTFKRPMVIAVSIFVAACELASIFALDAHAAFWSNYERGEGGFQMLHYYVFFLLLAFLFQHEEDWKNLFKFSLVAAGGMVGYGVLANLGYPNFISPYTGGTVPTGWFHQLIDGRFQGSLGNPAYVAPYLMFSMFFAAYLWCASKVSGALANIKSWGYGILIALFVFFFYLSETRGAFLGLAAAIFIFLGYLVFQESRFIRKLAVTITLLPALLIFLAELFVLGHSFLSAVLAASVVGGVVGILTFLACLAFSKNASFRQWSRVILGLLVVLVIILAIVFVVFVHSLAAAGNLPGARLFQISTSDSSAQTRFWVWGEAWQGFLQRPIFGWGQENFTAVFDKFFNPNFYAPGQNNETWFDRAHSVFFDYLAETGIVGFLSYIGMFIVFAWEFFRRKIRDIAPAGNPQTAQIIQNGLILAMPIGYLVQGIAIFDVLPMYVPLFVFLAFSSYYFKKHEPHA